MVDWCMCVCVCVGGGVWVGGWGLLPCMNSKSLFTTVFRNFQCALGGKMGIGINHRGLIHRIMSCNFSALQELNVEKSNNYSIAYFDRVATFKVLYL